MTELAPGSVTIADLYRELIGMRNDINKALTRIEVLDTRHTDIDQLGRDHESRLRALERFRYTLAGMAVLGGAASGYIGYLLGHFAH